MTDRRLKLQSSIDEAPLPKPSLLIEQLQKRLANKGQQPKTRNALKPSGHPGLTVTPAKHSETSVQSDPSDECNFMDIVSEATTGLRGDTEENSRFSRAYDVNPETEEDVIVILPQQQQRNPTFRRISARYSKQMEDYHERYTLSRERIVESRLNYLLDQWFSYPEHQNRITRGIPILVIQTIAKILNLEVSEKVKEADRKSSIIINRESKIQE